MRVRYPPIIYTDICISILLTFVAGFAFLPFLWAVNAVWFVKEAFVVPHYEEQKQIKRCKFLICRRLLSSLLSHFFFLTA